MSDINVVVLVGRLTRDSVLKEFAKSVKCSFTIAVDKRVKKGDQWQDKTSFFDIEAWNIGNLADFLTKGKRVTINGQLDSSTWEDNGQKRTRVFVRAEQIQLTDSINRQGNNGNQQKQRYADDNGQSTSVFDDDNIPF